jgi:adenylate kinase family enzyme
MNESKTGNITFAPGITVKDKLANFWLNQVTIRLRREVWWNWHERGLSPADSNSALPPFTDQIPAIMEMEHFYILKQEFFDKDATAKYLNSKLNVKLPGTVKSSVQGSFTWVVKQLKLDNISCFTLALAIETMIDNALGSVIASCLNDPAMHKPNLALVQKLWDNPNEVIKLYEPSHPLFMYGLLLMQNPDDHHSYNIFNIPFSVPTVLIQQLISPGESLPQFLKYLDCKNKKELFISDRINAVSRRLKSNKQNQLYVIPVLGSKGSSFAEPVTEIAEKSGRKVVRFTGESYLLANLQYLKSIVSLCWLKHVDLFLDNAQITVIKSYRNEAQNFLLELETLPVAIYLSIHEKNEISHLPSKYVLSFVEAKVIDNVVKECSRRFRFEKETIKSICSGLNSYGKQLKEKDIFDACRTEISSDIGDLALPVIPRFQNEELVLPLNQRNQFNEIINAMKSLTKVHYELGTGKVWNESGISVLFSGSPGTGKTMAAEILAIKLDLPLYRIDLSQVVNKYIGETEKNLKKIFDAADQSDTILFFDEADALFGKRTDVKDSHDRYANLQTSYLLERMERFKGLAILATNRKKNIDEAFLRRLRYIIDFPLPSTAERERIWRQVVPETIDSSEIDFDYLSKQYQLTGGNIRSIVFNACLQSVNGKKIGDKKLKAKLSMDKVMIALKREYDKINRSITAEQLGIYASLLKETENEPIPN